MTVDGGPATVPDACSKCGTTLDFSGQRPGLWLSCPSCGQPVLVRGRLRSGPTGGLSTSSQAAVPFVPDPPAPSSGRRRRPFAWLASKDEVKENAEPGSETAGPVAAPFTPLPPRSPRMRWSPVLMLTVVGALAQVVFAAVVFVVVNLYDIVLAAAFGASLGFFLSSMAMSAVRER